MTYEEYCSRGYYAVDYFKLSQWQRARGIIIAWRKSKARDKGISFCALWDASDESQDWERVGDWWHPRQWRRWHFGIWSCQNFEHISLGPCEILVAI